jgi:hypothetical protein
MFKIAFAALLAIITLVGMGLVTLPAWALVAGGAGMAGGAALRRRKPDPDGEVTC